MNHLKSILFALVLQTGMTCAANTEVESVKVPGR